jgi:hypothetical protein
MLDPQLALYLRWRGVLTPVAGALQKVVDDNVVHGWQALLGAVCSHAASDAHDPRPFS